MPETLTASASDSLLPAPAILFNGSSSALPLISANNILVGVNQPLKLVENETIKALPLANNGIFPTNSLGASAASQTFDKLTAGAKAASNSSAPSISDITGVTTSSVVLDPLLAPSSNKFSLQNTNSYLANTNDKSLLFSPYNWMPVDNGVQTSDAGAYLKFKFNGAQAILDVDTSSQTSFPLLNVYVDGKQTTDQLWLKNITNGQVKLFDGNAGNHEVTVYFRRRELYDGNNPAVTAVKQQDWLTDAEHWRVTGVEVKGGSGFLTNTFARSKTALFLGDSLTEGYAEYFDPNTPDRPSTVTGDTRNSIAYKTYAAQLGELLHVDYGQVSWCGAGWTQPITATGNPTISDTWLRYNGASTVQRDFQQQQPDYVFINLGTNDGAFDITNKVSTWLTQARQIIPNAEIFVVAPFNQTKNAQLEQGIRDYQTTRVTDQKVHFLSLGAEGALGLNGIYNPDRSKDGVHPTIERHKQLAGLLYDQIKPIVGITNTTIQSADINSGTGLNHIRYNGSWNNTSTLGAINSNYTSNELNATYEVTFWGDNLRLFGAKGKNEGIAAISIDGGNEIEVDLFSNRTKSNALIYNLDQLGAGFHTIKVRVTGQKNTSSIGSNINLGKLRVW
jgi:lysophospholipase L1-like esterase